MEVYEGFLRAGYTFKPRVVCGHIETKAFPPPYVKYVSSGKISFRRGEIARIAAYEPGIGLGTALVGSAMSFFEHRRWRFSTGFRDENGRLFASHLASTKGIELGYRSKGQDWFPTHGVPVSFAVPRRRWVLIYPTRDIEQYGYCPSGADSEAAAVARKLLQRADGNSASIIVPSFLYSGLRDAFTRAREYLLSPPVLTALGDRVSLDMRGHRRSYSPVPAITSDCSTYELVSAGAIPDVVTFVQRRGQPPEAARLFY